ncbi:MarR family winged helix-turn-helix transcriptional regulator [Parenemella sanctibonifatiensis]|uniref:MarR family transcriptional regulator n=1 Tax=Parenemella sanctibonifatiensis TaxID=2016505 RepID=A0A255E7F1_9ACTN|nr:MarR family transcriptional regulator [Parenemella sanctibonifatiensis]OYN87464.1 MarR family transcriptional regulator [Parenemella sanctibonifatiensis]
MSEGGSSTEGRDLAEVAHRVRHACMRVTRKVRYEASALPPHLFTVLAMLEGGPRTAAELAHREQISAPSMSRTIKDLTTRGWIDRTPHPTDGRQQLLDLTEEGRAELKAARQQRQGWMVKRLVSSTPEELDILERAAAILHRLVDESHSPRVDAPTDAAEPSSAS